MNIYLINTKHAAEGIFGILSVERQRLRLTQDSHDFMQASARSLFESMKQSAFDSTGIIELCGIESAKDRFKGEVEQLNRLIHDLRPAFNSLAGSALQIAKQGISSTYNGLAACPTGRFIGSTECLKNVIWQGRNQSMHYEEGRYHTNVQSCFSNLSSDFGVLFSLGTDNLALAIVELLGWHAYEDYERDMLTLLP